MNDMMANENYWQKDIQPNPFKVFIYTSDQLHDNNETRQMQFQRDLQHFLRLKTPLTNFDQIPKSNVQKSSRYKEHINNICDAEFADLRNQLLKQGEKSSQWIRSKFIMSKDVVVSDKDFFSSVLSGWDKDPCPPELTKLGVPSELMNKKVKLEQEIKKRELYLQEENVPSFVVKPMATEIGEMKKDLLDINNQINNAHR